MSSLTLVTLVFLLVAVVVALGIVVAVALPNLRAGRTPGRPQGHVQQGPVRAPRGHSSRTGQRPAPPTTED
ncbi:hypothetical protein ACXET9_01705 [Brachybacterium sp. DNPG3]